MKAARIFESPVVGADNCSLFSTLPQLQALGVDLPVSFPADMTMAGKTARYRDCLKEELRRVMGGLDEQDNIYDTYQRLYQSMVEGEGDATLEEDLMDIVAALSGVRIGVLKAEVDSRFEAVSVKAPLTAMIYSGGKFSFGAGESRLCI